ncbi:recombinase family protein [Enterocloster clostridioformis]|uniref:recombinase family protein n=1 Tax=Enterocloster clostridioformis TaxID=1531 RepID=UPI001F291EEA|nr:recombinase family protein [Enterocloster clostridioformis]MCF2705103.1 recombinase family protein [Enterocloster clostridioformis]
MLDPNGIYFAYLRKSREDREAELHGDGETLKRHQRMLEDLAKYHNIKIAKFYSEVVSGETIASRPQMLAMLDDIESLAPDGVLVVEIERLARGDTRDQGLVLETFKCSGTRIITPMKIYDPTDEQDEEYAEFGLFMSRREYKTINRRLRNGKIASFNEGKWTGSKAPYGYERVKLAGQKGFSLNIIPEKADVVRFIFQLFVYGTPESNNIPVGTSKICRILDDMHISPPSADTWQPCTIRDILGNPAYIGKVHTGRRSSQKKTSNGIIKISRPVSKDIKIADGVHPAIIDDSLYSKAQEKRKANYQKPFFEGIKNPLAGLVYCSVCGKSMYRRPAGKRCKEDMIQCNTHGCPTSASYYHYIEEKLLLSLNKWLEDYRIQVGNISPASYAHQINLLKSQLNAAQTESETSKKQLSKAMDLLEKDIYSVEMFQQRASELNEKIALSSRSISDLSSKIDSLRTKAAQKEEVIARWERVLSLYPQVDDPAVKNALMKELVTRIEYSKPHKGNRQNGGMDQFTLKLFPRL